VVKKDGDEEACGQEKDGRKENVSVEVGIANLWRVAYGMLQPCCCVCVPVKRKRTRPVKRLAKRCILYFGEKKRGSVLKAESDRF
jgi:hypothetical protein